MVMFRKEVNIYFSFFRKLARERQRYFVDSTVITVVFEDNDNLVEFTITPLPRHTCLVITIATSSEISFRNIHTTTTPSTYFKLVPGTSSGLVVICLAYQTQQLQGCWFDSWLVHCQITTLGKLFTHTCLCHQTAEFGINLTAEKVTAVQLAAESRPLKES